MNPLGIAAGLVLAFAPVHYGSGAGSVWVLRPSGPVRDVVVFAHGWKHAPSPTARPWVEQFRPWLTHLLAEDTAVVFPQYQLGGDDPGPARVDSFRRGLQLGFHRLGGGGVPVVAAGYSFGGSLVFYYAAEARRWGLPEPRAVDSIFPVGPIPGAPVTTLPSLDRAVLEVGDRDVVAGRSGADAWWRLLARARRRRLLLVRSTPTFVADHAAPKRTGAGARAAFWRPLDVLLAGARPS